MGRGGGPALLLGKGYRLLGRNRRTPFGEVDLFLEKAGVYVVVEVKQRGRKPLWHALEAITPKKCRGSCEAPASSWGGTTCRCASEAVLVQGTPATSRLEHLVLEL